MKNYSTFDILGPIMVGPSSSHTAGAARLGKMGRSIAAEEIKEVIFYLHGSFGATYKGHGTDKALVAGILGMEPHDSRLREAFQIAEQQGLRFKFQLINIENAHPNTVEMKMITISNRKVNVIGSSIGGGNIKITKINGLELEFTGQYPTLITKHVDKPGIIAKVTTILAAFNVNIAFMKVFRQTKGKMASMIVETDQPIPQGLLDSILNTSEIEDAVIINSV